MSRVFLTSSSGQTKKIGRNLAIKILKNSAAKKAFLIGLVGELGGGKTTFLQGLAKGLGIKEKILSPTFVILKRFQVSGPRFQNFYHIDCYRIREPKELLDLGFEKIVSSPKNIVAIEWADRIKGIMPKETTWIKFKFINAKTRKLMLK